MKTKEGKKKEKNKKENAGLFGDNKKNKLQ